MRASKCSNCGGHSNHQSELWPTLWLCNGCRCRFLRGLLDFGAPLSNNPLIFELCTGTHYFESACHNFRYVDKHGEWKTYHIHHDRLNTKPVTESDIYFADPLDFVFD